MRKRIIGVASAVVILMLAAFYFFADPENSRIMPKCVFRTITGWDCPGCGSQRVAHALLHGDFGAAWGYNPFLCCMIPVIGGYMLIAAFPKKFPRLFRIFHSPAMIIAIIIAIIAWWITRNIL